MKYLRPIGIILVCLSCLCLSFNRELDAKPKPDLQFYLVFDKDEYKVGDSISIDFKLKNTGDKPIYVNKRFFVNSEDAEPGEREVTLSLIGPQGEELPFRRILDTGFPKTDYFVLLEPGAEATPKRKKNLKAYFDLKDPGEYKIIAVYQNTYGAEIGLDAFKDKITSEPMTIKIVE